MLTYLYIVIVHATQSVAIRGARKSLASRRWPGGSRDLQSKPFTGVVPRDHAFRVTPRSATLLGTSADHGIIIELIIPDHVVERPVVYFVECCSDRISSGVAHTIASPVKRGRFATRIDELLAEAVMLWFAAKRALSTDVEAATRTRPLMGLPGGDDVLDFRDRAVLKTYLYTELRLATAGGLRVRTFTRSGSR